VAPGNVDNLIRLKGDIDATGAGSEGVRIEGDGTTLKVGKSSQVEANVGVRNDSQESIIRNAGDIEGGDYGIYSDTSAEIVNTGRIAGDTAILGTNGNFLANRETGVIEGGELGIRYVGLEMVHIVNEGVIRSDDVAMSISGHGSVLTNTGRIVGDVLFGGGDDTIDTRSGTIKGVVDAGGGDDTYIVGKGGGILSEQSGNGWDAVHSTRSVTLIEDFEELRLLGKKSTDGTGNGAANEIYGNKGDNVLHGKGGNDLIRGGRGDDEVFGGNGADDFVFKVGDDRDTVMDFDLALDQVALTEFGFDNFAEVQVLMSQHGDDTWISLGGGDRVILKDVDKDNLTEDNFLFGYLVSEVM
jgi:Ca2+-binding RTX toxin-like protein